MTTPDALRSLLKGKLDNRLDAHIASIDLTSISRISAERVETATARTIGIVELVSRESFATSYKELYEANFHGGERERSDLIVERLEADFAHQRQGLAPYRVLGIRNCSRQAVAAAQFSVLFLTGGRLAVPYLQYLYVRREHRRQGLSEILHTLILAVALADAARSDSTLSVPFTLFETEPPVHGADEVKRAVAAQRTQIHSRSGSMALMLRQKSDGKVLSTHVQPGLEVGDLPLTYIWALRANPTSDLCLGDETAGKALIAAYYQSLRDEGFPEENISLAERIVESRYSRGVEFCLMPLSEITTDMYVGIDA